MLPGIDVSNHQGGAIDWDAVRAAGTTFAFAKASEGTTLRDPHFARNWAEMARVGLVRGAYHYAQPDRNAAIPEADWFLSCVGPLAPGDLLALDMEEGSGPLADWTLAFLERVQTRIGLKCVIYTGQWFIDAHALADARLADYGLWLASWQATLPPAPAPWPVIAFWQYSATGSMPGVPGHCDLDAFNGDAAALALYGVQPEPEPEPEPAYTLDGVKLGLISKVLAEDWAALRDDAGRLAEA